ncbi:MAG: DUF559 domain-containing protein [Actinomycetota bacterium]|nr:DUF559 domain-containing protein [Actinomycetota bacterium]
MPRPLQIPSSLASKPFTSGMAEAAGLPRTALRGKRFRRLFRDVYVHADLDLNLVGWLRAALLVLPKDAVVSHVTALWLYGVEIGSPSPFEFSTNSGLVTKLANIRLHRRQGRIAVHERGRLPVTGPDRTIVDCATRLSFVQFVQAADWLISTGATTVADLMEYADSRHLSGVLRARRALLFVRERVDSPMETLVRLMLVFARLPEPECNPDIVDAHGNFIARGDMVYFGYKVLVEYDGWQHERDARQRQRDRERREALEANGWRVIVITSEDLKRKHLIPRRVFEALADRGYEGQPPKMNAMWSKWFA